MRTYNTLIPFVTLALTLAANAAPTPSPSNERGYAQTAVARGVFDVPVEARGVVDVPPLTPSSSFTSSIYRRHQEPTEGTHHITEYYAPEKKPKSGEFENANQHHSGGPPGVNPQHHQQQRKPSSPRRQPSSPPRRQPYSPGSPLANEKNEGHRPPHHEGNPTPPGSPLANEHEVDKKHEGNHPGDEKHEGNHPGDAKPKEGDPQKKGFMGKISQAKAAMTSDQAKKIAKYGAIGTGIFVAGGVSGAAIAGGLAYEAGSSSSGQTGTGATSTGMTEGGGVAGSANMDMTAGGATGTSDGSMGMGDGSMGTGTGTSDGSMGMGTGTGTAMRKNVSSTEHHLSPSLPSLPSFPSISFTLYLLSGWSGHSKRARADMRTQKTLIPFITLALALAAHAVPIVNPSAHLSIISERSTINGPESHPVTTKENTPPSSPRSSQGEAARGPHPQPKMTPPPSPVENKGKALPASGAAINSPAIPPRPPKVPLERPGPLTPLEEMQWETVANHVGTPPGSPPPTRPLPPVPKLPIGITHDRYRLDIVPEHSSSSPSHSRNPSGSSEGVQKVPNFSRPLSREKERKEGDVAGKKEEGQHPPKNSLTTKQKWSIAAGGAAMLGTGIVIGDLMKTNENGPSEMGTANQQSEPTSSTTSTATDTSSEPTAPPQKRDTILLTRSLFHRRIPSSEFDVED
ncbi:hypothetical protein C8R42DRAFT_644778 [Lentinula raphanica]|nr:hypothetical protein C8R42DRAFT_644778 [Lentinula raphanica]